MAASSSSSSSLGRSRRKSWPQELSVEVLVAVVAMVATWLATGLCVLSSHKSKRRRGDPLWRRTRRPDERRSLRQPNRLPTRIRGFRRRQVSPGPRRIHGHRAAGRDVGDAATPAARRGKQFSADVLVATGDFINAAGFLGLTGLVALSGSDALIYCVGWVAAWPIAFCLTAEPLRALGPRNFAEALAVRFRENQVRHAAAPALIAVVLFYLAAQFVGAGTLAHLLFGVSYETAIVCVGAVVAIAMLLSAVNAARWVMTIRNGLLLVATVGLAGAVLVHFRGNPFGGAG